MVKQCGLRRGGGDPRVSRVRPVSHWGTLCIDFMCAFRCLMLLSVAA